MSAIAEKEHILAVIKDFLDKHSERMQVAVREHSLTIECQSLASRSQIYWISSINDSNSVEDSGPRSPKRPRLEQSEQLNTSSPHEEMNLMPTTEGDGEAMESQGAEKSQTTPMHLEEEDDDIIWIPPSSHSELIEMDAPGIPVIPDYLETLSASIPARPDYLETLTASIPNVLETPYIPEDVWNKSYGEISPMSISPTSSIRQAYSPRSPSSPVRGLYSPPRSKSPDRSNYESETCGPSMSITAPYVPYKPASSSDALYSIIFQVDERRFVAMIMNGERERIGDPYLRTLLVVSNYSKDQNLSICSLIRVKAQENLPDKTKSDELFEMGKPIPRGRATEWSVESHPVTRTLGGVLQAFKAKSCTIRADGLARATQKIHISVINASPLTLQQSIGAQLITEQVQIPAGSRLAYNGRYVLPPDPISGNHSDEMRVDGPYSWFITSARLKNPLN